MRYLISGGGTGGHIYPAIAIADKIAREMPEAEILFVGARNGLEMELVPRAGYRIVPIHVTYLKRKISWHNVQGSWTLVKGLWEARKILNHYQPDWVIGTGGFVSGPVVYWAAKKGYSTLLHEQNAYPGLTNRILSRVVDVVALGFQEAAASLRVRGKVVITGNPIRQEYYELSASKTHPQAPQDDTQPTVLIVGGSGGSAHINEAVLEMIRSNPDLPFCLHWATGHFHYQNVREALERSNASAFLHKHRIVPYIDQMPQVLVASNLVVCSAGAITIAEIQAAGKYAILIPKAYTAGNHQTRNARMMEKMGFASVIHEPHLTGELLYQTILESLKKPFLQAEPLVMHPATDRIWSIISPDF